MKKYSKKYWRNISYIFVHNRSILIEELPPARADCTVVLEIHLTRLKKKETVHSCVVWQICLKCTLIISPFLYEKRLAEMKEKPPLINKDRRLGSWQDQGWHRRGRRLARGRRWPARPSPYPPTPWWSPPWMNKKLKKMENCCESGFVDNFVMP